MNALAFHVNRPGIDPQPRDALLDVYANRAHNDVLELWLEAGAVGLVLMTIFVLWLMVETVRVWWSRGAYGEQVDRALARAATLIIALLIAHSFVDYPLRTNAMMAIAAFCCALLVRPPLLDGVSSQAEPGPAGEPRPQSSRWRRLQFPDPAVPGTATSLPGAVAPSLLDGTRHGTPEGAADRPRPVPWGGGIEWPDAWQEPSKPDHAGGRDTPPRAAPGSDKK